MGSTTLQLAAVVVVALASTAVAAFEAFVPSLAASQIMLPMASQRQHATSRSYSRQQRRATLGMKYIPDGLSPEQWKKMQKEEAAKKKKMGDLGQVGVSFQAPASIPGCRCVMLVILLSVVGARMKAS